MLSACLIASLIRYELSFLRSAVELMGEHRADAYSTMSPTHPTGAYGLVKVRALHAGWLA